VSHLSAKDIARELGISRSAAYEVIRQMPHVRCGRVVRVSSQAFARWRELNTVQPWQSSTKDRVARTGGSGSVRASAAVVTRQAAPIGRRPKLQLVTPSAAPSIRPIVPRTKPRSGRP
jgi:hypothetical protein